MSDIKKPSLEAPSQTLIDEFSLAIDGILPEGVNELSFPPDANGRTIAVSKYESELEGDESCHSVMFSEKIVGPNDITLRHKTFYHVYESGEVAKDVKVEAVRDPATQAEIDQIVSSQRDLLRVLGSAGIHEDERLAVLSKDTTLPSDNDWVVSIANSLLGSQLDEEFDFIGASYDELKGVVDEVRAAAAAMPS